MKYSEVSMYYGIKNKSNEIIVVDDRKDITDVLMVYCESKGIKCALVDTGIDDLEIIRNNNNFDLILLDLTMPAFIGLDVIKSLKNENLLEQRNIVVFTVSSDPKVIRGNRKKWRKIYIQ